MSLVLGIFLIESFNCFAHFIICSSNKFALDFHFNSSFVPLEINPYINQGCQRNRPPKRVVPTGFQLGDGHSTTIARISIQRAVDFFVSFTDSVYYEK